MGTLPRHLTLGTGGTLTSFPPDCDPGVSTLSRSAGEGLKVARSESPLPHRGRGGTQPARAGWVRVCDGGLCLVTTPRLAGSNAGILQKEKLDGADQTKVTDLEAATRFYENVFGFRQVKTGRSRGHISRHLTDGYVDLALMVYDSEEDEEAKLVGEGPAIHHFGIEVDDRRSFIEKIEANGGTLLSKPDSGTVKFRSPDGTIAEIVDVGRYEKMRE